MTVATFVVSIVAIFISVVALYAQLAGLGLDKKSAKFTQSGLPTVSAPQILLVSSPRSYAFEVFNAGQAALRDLSVELHDKQHNNVAEENTDVGPLEPFGRKSLIRTVQKTYEQSDPLHIHLKWRDASKTARRSMVSKVAVPRPASLRAENSTGPPAPTMLLITRTTVSRSAPLCSAGRTISR